MACGSDKGESLTCASGICTSVGRTCFSLRAQPAPRRLRELQNNAGLWELRSTLRARAPSRPTRAARCRARTRRAPIGVSCCRRRFPTAAAAVSPLRRRRGDWILRSAGYGGTCSNGTCAPGNLISTAKVRRFSRVAQQRSLNAPGARRGSCRTSRSPYPSPSSPESLRCC